MADDVLGLVTEAAPRTLAELRRIARTRELGPGEFLVRQGDALELYVVLEGWLAARRTSAGGRTYTMAILHDGAVGGVQSAWRDGPSMFDIVALTSARVATLKGSRVRSIAKRDPALAYRLFVLAASATIGIGERMDGAVFDIARKRLVRVLLRYEPIISGPSPILSRTDLAGLIETSREMLGIAIRALEADGLIRRDGRRIAIVNRPALEREAELTETAAGQESWAAVVAAHWPDDLAV